MANSKLDSRVFYTEILINPSHEGKSLRLFEALYGTVSRTFMIELQLKDLKLPT